MNTQIQPTTLPDVMGIKLLVKLSGYSENYIRKAISKGDLKVTKGTYGDTSIPKNYITREDFLAWRAEASTRTQREDGRNKFVLYMTAEEEAEARKLLAGLEFGETLVRANVKPVAEPEAE